LRSALDEYLVLYLPGQSLDRFQLDWLGRFFGPPFLHPLVNNGYPDCPAVLELLRKPEDTIGFGGEGWDADVTWMNPVGYVSILHGLEIPAVGGDTGFASTHAAYDALSPGMQKLLDGMEAVHTCYGYLRREDPQRTVTHPVVRTDPVNGRKGLYVNGMFSNRFNLETAVGRARVGCDGVRWQGETTLRAPERKEKQRRKRAPARLNRVRSAVTLEVTLLVRTKAGVHKAYPAEESGQLRFLGSRTWVWRRARRCCNFCAPIWSGTTSPAAFAGRRSVSCCGTTASRCITR